MWFAVGAGCGVWENENVGQLPDLVAGRTGFPIHGGASIQNQVCWAAASYHPLHIFSLGPMQPSIALCCGQMLCSTAKKNTSEYCLLLGKGLSSPDKLQCLRVCYIGHFWFLKYAY